jgi:hypothetical protein
LQPDEPESVGSPSRLVDLEASVVTLVSSPELIRAMRVIGKIRIVPEDIVRGLKARPVDGPECVGQPGTYAAECAFRWR